MHISLLIARLFLSCIFAVAALAKFADRSGTQRALSDFGVTSRFVAPLAILLPLVELTASAMLVPLPTAWVGSVASLGLLLLFVLAIAINLASGRTPECHCFGQLSSSPIGWATLSRNIVLVCIAGFVMLLGRGDPGTSAVAWIGRLSLSQTIFLPVGLGVLGLMVAEAFILLQIMRQQGRVLLKLDSIEAALGHPRIATQLDPGDDAAVPGLAVGSPAPGFRLSGMQGETVSLDALLSSKNPLMLLFTSPKCGPCRALMPEVAQWQRHARDWGIVVIAEGSTEDNRAEFVQHGVTEILLQQEREVAEVYHAYGTPAAVLVKPDHTIGSALALGADAIRALANRLPDSRNRLYPSGKRKVSNPSAGHGVGHIVPVHSHQAQFGDPAPRLKLKNLRGQTVEVRDFLGSEVLLLFWNPQCSFCQHMLDDLRDLEASAGQVEPRIVVVSTGTPEEGRGMELRSPLLLDPDAQAGAAFGVHGTPMAVLIDAHGKIASEVVGGGRAILELAASKGLSPSRLHPLH